MKPVVRVLDFLQTYYFRSNVWLTAILREGTEMSHLHPAPPPHTASSLSIPSITAACLFYLLNIHWFIGSPQVPIVQLGTIWCCTLWVLDKYKMIWVHHGSIIQSSVITKDPSSVSRYPSSSPPLSSPSCQFLPAIWLNYNLLGPILWLDLELIFIIFLPHHWQPWHLL